MEKSNRIIKAGLGYTIGNVLIKGISFLTIPVYTRLMRTDDYGRYNTYAAYLSIVAFIVCLGLDPTLRNAEYDHRERRGTYLSTVYILTLAATVLLLAAGWMLAPVLERAIGIDRTLITMLVIQSEATAVINIYNIRLSLNYESTRYLLISFFNTICSIALSVTLILTVFRDRVYMGRIVGSFVPCVFIAAVILWRHIVMHRDARFDRALAGYGLTLGLPLIPHLLAQTVNSQMDRVMISHMVGYSESGIYSFTYNIAIILQIVYLSFDMVWGAWFFNEMDIAKGSGDHSKIREGAGRYLALMVFCTVSLMTVSKELIQLFGARDYWEGTSLCQPLLVGIFFLYLYTLPVSIEYFLKKTRFIAYGSVAAAAVNVLLNLFCIRAFGYRAAAYTTLASYCILFLIHWTIYLKLRPDRLFNVRDILLAVGTVVAFAVLTALMKDMWLMRYGLYILFFIIMVYRHRDLITQYLRQIGRHG